LKCHDDKAFARLTRTSENRLGLKLKKGIIRITIGDGYLGEQLLLRNWQS